jgi:hypothetical protein
MVLKFCNSCKTEHPITHFYKCAKSKDGVQSRCKDCDKKYHHARYLKDKEKINKQSKEWRNANKDRANLKSSLWKQNNKDKVKKYQRISNLRKNFKLEVEDYEKMYEEQKGLCAICNKPETYIHQSTGKPPRLSVDHCHSRGKIRKLLCKACNQGLGLFKDNPEILRKAANYVESF